MKRKPRRARPFATVLASLSLAILTVAVTAPAGAALAHHKARSHGSVTLTFLNAYTGTQVTTMEHVVIPKFEKLNPGIKVKNISVPYSDTLQKFLAEAAAGNPPDLLRSDIAWMAELAGDGTALRVSNLSWYKKDAITKNALTGPLLTTQFKGNAYGLPLDTNTIALYYNKTDFTAAGLSGPPTTVAQLISDAKALTIPSKSQYGLGVDSTDIWDVSPYIWSQCGSFTNSGYTKATGFMNSGSTKDAVAMLVGGYAGGHGYIGPDIVNTTGDSGEQEFPLGKYAMYIDGPWAVPTFQALSPAPSYGIVPMPSGKCGSHTPTGGEDVVVAKGGHHLTDAELFAQFLTEPFAQLAMAKVGQMSAYSTDSTAEVRATPYYKTFASALKNAYVRPVTKAYGLVDTAFSNAFEEILAGKTNVTAGLNQAAAQANAALAGNG